MKSMSLIVRTLALLMMVLIGPIRAHAQVVLEADGPGDTYELITRVLAPGNGMGAVENPECIHPEFGRHIAEVWDSVLNQYVFEFYIHVTPDNDRCTAFDRQRIEIKTYEPSPDYLKGVVGETITYTWKFRLNPGYQPSSKFTHIHQIKAVGGDDGNPIFTLTPRKGSPNVLELIHDNTTKVTTAPLSSFDGVWVQCKEVILVHPVNGTYSMTIKRVSDGTTLLSYSNNKIMTIRADNTFIRPKWGIYRSLDSPTDLRDEAVRFAGFSIQEGVSTTGVDRSEPVPASQFCLAQNYPNPFNPTTNFEFRLPARVPDGQAGIANSEFVRLRIYDVLGREVATLVNGVRSPGAYTVPWDASLFPSGVYFYHLEAGRFTAVKKIILSK
jgi:hypothetical protein